MNDEIKEILNGFKEILDNPTTTDECYDGRIIEIDRSYDLDLDEIKTLLDYITNLQQAIKVKNERIKEEKQEKERYIKFYNELNIWNKELQQNQRYYKNGVFSLEYDKETMSDMIDDYKSRVEKAVEYINGTTFFGLRSGKTFMSKYLNDLLNILNGKE